MGDEWHGYYVFLAQHRDSDVVTRSNFQVGLAALGALPEWTDEENDSRIVVRESHWAVGWVEWIAIHENDAEAIAAADDMLERLSNYPALDDDHWTQLEYDEAAEWWVRMSVRDRLDAIARSRCDCSPFAARHDYLPSDDNGALLQYLSRD